MSILGLIRLVHHPGSRAAGFRTCCASSMLVCSMLANGGSTILHNFVICLGKAAVGTEDEQFDVLVHHILQYLVGMMTIDNGPVGFGIIGGLRTQLSSKELQHKSNAMQKMSSPYSRV